MNRPKIVCLCGSTRFTDAYQQANLEETLKGHIVLTIGCDMRSDRAIFEGYSNDELREVKARLDTLHLHKIDLCDEVYILNVGGYVGDSTRREIRYAREHGKVIKWLEVYQPEDIDSFCYPDAPSPNLPIVIVKLTPEQQKLVDMMNTSVSAQERANEMFAERDE